MVVQEQAKSFDPCPEYTGAGVCVDITPTKEVQTDYGPKEKFRIVFETLETREDGSRYCVWSSGFTATLGEKSGLRKFLKLWLGRDLTPAERSGFDLETLLGRPANLVVVHDHKDDQTYANIAACTPWKGEAIEPSGTFVRAKDREQKADGKPGGGKPATKDSTFQRTTKPATASPARATTTPPTAKPATTAAAADGDPSEPILEWQAVKVHVGKAKGSELRELSVEQIEALVAGWVPLAKAAPKLLKADKELLWALEEFVKERSALAEEGAGEASGVELGDDVPF